jgi:putative Mn2+ efflux pump MntP
MNWINIAILLVTAGVAADNLQFARLSRVGFSVLKDHKFVLILLLLFIIQNEMLILGNATGIWTEPLMKGSEQWAAIGILVTMGIRMLQELSSKNREIRCASFETRDVLALAFSTSIYVFAFGCATHWLQVNEQETRISIMLLIFLFLTGGLLPGEFHYDKLLKWIHTMTAFLVLAGTFILLAQKFRGIVK